MSTKTTIKRIALVAVAALGFGVVSVAPSSAAVLNDTYTLSASTTTVSLGSAASVTLTTAGYFASANDSVTVTAALKTWPTAMTAAQIATSLAAPGVFSDVDTATAYTGGSAGGSSVVNSTNTSVTGVAGTAPKLVSTRSKLTVATGSMPVVGTYTFTLTPSGGANTTAVTWTVVVEARAALTAAATTALANYAYYGDATNVAIRGAWGVWSTTTDALTLSAYAAPSDSPSASVKVVQGNGNTTYPLIAADAVALTATVTSGPGLVAISGEGNDYSTYLSAKGIYAISTAGAVSNLGLTQYVYVYSTGAPGLVTVEIKAGTTVVGTKKINFYGAAATIIPTVAKAVIGPVATTGVVTAVVKDASGNAVPGVTVYAVSGTTAAISNSYTSCGASSATGAVSCDLTGVAAGTSAVTLTLNSASTGTSAVSATPVSVRVSDGVATAVAYAFAADSYAPGAAATITATVSNAAGVMPAGTYTVLTAGVTGNYVLTGGPGLTVTTTDATGVVKYTVTVPVGTSGDLTLTGTAVTTVTATFGKTTIVNVAQDTAQAAVDAAAEAIDAANAATDAANAAAEAADAATAAAQDAADAVAALSVAVTAQIDALKAQNDALRKQLIALTNLIIKIQKKVKA
jgi:hypothetical protein